VKKLFLASLLSLFGVAAFAADEKTEEILVTISPANTCYKAMVLHTKERGQLVQSISAQVPCNDKPATLLPVLKMEKVGEKCGYTVGKFPGFARTHQLNGQFNFSLVARCPTDEK
jgi:hypothetical protein